MYYQTTTKTKLFQKAYIAERHCEQCFSTARQSSSNNKVLDCFHLRQGFGGLMTYPRVALAKQSRAPNKYVGSLAMTALLKHKLIVGTMKVDFADE